MPLKRDTKLFDQFAAAVHAAGWRCFPLTARRVHPARYRVTHGEVELTVTVYIWETTLGGNNRPPDEWRIQPTGVVGSQFQPEPEPGRTLILGWWKQGNIFTGYDYNFHVNPFGGSPSIQVRRRALDAAAADGMAVYQRGSGELAILFRPELIGAYLSEMQSLHAAGRIPLEVTLIEKIAQSPELVADGQIAAEAAPPRQHAMAVVRRAIRDAKFRNLVLEAYGHRCAFCGIQLRLLEAAHILPVEHPDSTDSVNNGFAACPLHHRAYDRGLITFGTAYGVQVSDAKILEMQKGGHGGGLTAFRDGLLPKIHLPVAAGDRPSASLVKTANTFRGW